MTYSDRRVGDVLNEGAVPVALDFDDEGERAEAWGVTVIPAAVFVNPDTGRAFERVGHSIDPEGFSADVRKIVEGYAAARTRIAAVEADLAAGRDGPGARSTLGRALEATGGDPARIRAAYEAVATLADDPADAVVLDARRRLAGLSLAEGDRAAADAGLTSLLADLDRMESPPAERAEVLYDLARVRILGRKASEGVALLDRLVTEHPDHARALEVVERKLRERFR